MKEIKYEAWNKDHKFMGLVTRLDFYNGLVVVDHKEKGTSHTFGLMHVNLRQYTGLKDKNGVEIYEGDIVILERDESKSCANEPYRHDYGDVFEVIWSDVNLAYYLDPVKKDKDEIQMDYYGAWSGWNWLKVIGNKFENPDLLNG